MFEKDAEEWVKENMDCCKTDNSVNQPIPYFDEEERCCAKSAFKDGAEFGYNKANEWHYVKDGDLPDEDVYVYLWFRGEEYPTVARRHTFKEWGRLKWCWDCKWGSGYTIEADNDRIIAWKEIVPPKEEQDG